MDEIVNKVANSGIITIDLEELYVPGERLLFDIKQHLFQGLILREKDFREFIKSHDWSQYQDKLVAVTCSVDAIVPTWAYMLLGLAFAPYAKKVVFGNLETLENELFNEKLNEINLDTFTNARVVVKGCGSKPVPVNAFLKLSVILKPVARSIMYGEPCSTVPLYKSKS